MESSQQGLKRKDRRKGDLFLALLSLARLAAKLTLLASRSFSSVSEIDLIMIMMIYIMMKCLSVCVSQKIITSSIYGVSCNQL